MLAPFVLGPLIIGLALPVHLGKGVFIFDAPMHRVSRSQPSHEISSCHFYKASDPRAGTLVRTRAGHSTYAHVRLGPAEADPCAL